MRKTLGFWLIALACCASFLIGQSSQQSTVLSQSRQMPDWVSGEIRIYPSDNSSLLVLTPRSLSHDGRVIKLGESKGEDVLWYVSFNDGKTLFTCAPSSGGHK